MPSYPISFVLPYILPVIVLDPDQNYTPVINDAIANAQMDINSNLFNNIFSYTNNSNGSVTFGYNNTNLNNQLSFQTGKINISTATMYVGAMDPNITQPIGIDVIQRFSKFIFNSIYYSNFFQNSTNFINSINSEINTLYDRNFIGGIINNPVQASNILYKAILEKDSSRINTANFDGTTRYLSFIPTDNLIFELDFRLNETQRNYGSGANLASFSPNYILKMNMV